MVQFTKLRLQGFKSFVDQTELEIGEGLNGIVGPNGCGKSNLVEAMRWVMGESSAKKMRGGGMDDVIFAGTSSRPARNNAQVTLVLDNEDRSAPKPFEDLDELEITRKIEREAGSTYKINGKNVRARDVQLLFADTVSGANSAALISQGRVTTIISSKPSERRRILEESAGVAGLYARRHEAELRLKAAENNLVRLDDMMGEMENRLTALKRQARQATRYKNISSHIKELESLIACLEWHGNKTKLETLKKAFEEAETEVREYMGVVTALTKTEAEQSKDLPDLRKREAEAGARLQSQILEAQKIEDSKSRVESELTRLAEAIQQAQDDIAHEQDETPEVQKQLEERMTELGKLQESQTGEDLSGQKKELKETLAQEVSLLESNYRELQAHQARITASQDTVKQGLERAEKEYQNWTSEVERLETALAVHVAQNPDAQKLESLGKGIASLEKELGSLKTKRKETHAVIDQAQESVERIQDQCNEAQNKKSVLLSEINTLKEFIKSNSQGEFEPVLNDVQAQQGYETALAKAMGEGLNAALDASAQVYWQEISLKDLPELPEGAVSLLNLTKAPKALNAALSQIGVVDSQAQAKELLSSLKPGQMLVSKDGAVYRWDGFSVKAEAKSSAAVQLEQKNRLEELEKQIPSIEKQVEETEVSLDKVKKDLSTQKETLKSLNDQISDTEMRLSNAQSQRQSVQSEQEGWKIEKSRLQERVSQAKEMISSTKQAFEEAKAKLVEQEKADVSNISGQIEKIELQIAEKKELLEKAVQEYERYTLEKSQAKERFEYVTTEIERLKSRLSKTDERLTVFVSRKAEAQTKLDSLKGQPEELAQAFEGLQSRVVELEEEKRKVSDVLAEKEEELSGTKTALKEAEESLTQAREARAGAQSSLAAVQAQEEMARAHIQNDLSMTPEALTRHLDITEETELPTLSEAQEKREKLHRERDNMGAVNLRAEEEVAEIEKECGTMVTERDDLIAAIEQLRQGISKLNREARQRLKEAFESVNEHFKELFTRLYGGGQAYLELVESDDVLEAGLEIYASPPGKKLQSLSLLSGGEQTLASIALIFAMFLTNPSPICVLDEIDAPLDDANVDRVCGLLEEIAKRGYTRFLIVTHHRMTMARMDRLYGVTMSEKGVSQLVSVDMAVQGDLLVEAAE